MISKKFMLMAIFLVSLLAVSAVSANEINTTDEVAIDDGDLRTAEVSEDISADSQEDVLNAKDDGTFTALQKKINSTSEGSTITLENDYKYDEGFDVNGILISKSITINGNGHELNGLSESSIFNIESDSCTVVLKNIKFCNGYGGNGAAICSNGKLTINNCNFTNNRGGGTGGAIAAYNYLNVFDSYFTGNRNGNTRIIGSFDGGGAIYCSKPTAVDKCSFESNHANGIGGAIYVYGNSLTITNSNFVSNSASAEGKDKIGGDAGAVAAKDLTVYSSNFLSNTAEDEGGAISTSGGARNYMNIDVKDCYFENNRANKYGGAINWDGYYGNLESSTFKYNYAEIGDAVYWGSIYGNISDFTAYTAGSEYNVIVKDPSSIGNIKDLWIEVKKPVNIQSEDLIKYYGNSKKYTITLTNDTGAIANVNVKITVDGKIYSAETNSKGQASIDLNLDVGTYDVVTEYDGFNATSKVTVKSTITAKDTSGTYSNSKVTATFLNTLGNALASKQVTFKAGGKSYSATTNDNGVATASINLGVGTYTVTAVNPTTKEEKQFKLTISKASSTTSLTSSQKGKSVTLTATVTPSSVTGKVTFEINGKTKEASISNGKASVTFTDLSPDTYTAKATYGGDANYKTSSKTASVKVDKVYSITNVQDVQGTYLDSKVGATFLDANGKALANTKVTFKVGGKTVKLKNSTIKLYDKSYSATTDSKGVASANIPLGVGTYNITAVNPATKEEKQFKLTITKAISIPSLTAVQNGKSVTLTATLPSSSATGNVTFGINGKYYSSNLNNGKASVTVSDLAEGSYKASVAYSGDGNFSSIGTTSTFNVKGSNVLTVSGSSSGYYWDTKYLTITVKDSDGNPLANRDITVNMEGLYFDDPKPDSDVFYLTTGSDGKAKLKLYCDYVPDEYDLCFSSKGCEDVYKTFTIKKEIPKFTAKAKTFKKSVKIKKYSVTVKNHNNKPLKNEKIVIKVKGVSYTAKTNSKGVATFKINKLNKKGTYTAKIFMYWTSYYKSVTKKVKITVK